MASLQREQFGHYHIAFRLDGKRYKRSLHTQDEEKALSRKTAIEETIDLIERARLEVPEGVGVVEFILSDGKLKAPKTQAATAGNETARTITLKELFDQFFESIPDGNLEDTTLHGMHIHERHFLRTLKPSFEFHSLTLQDLQRYVNRRAKEHTQFRIDKQANGKKPRRTKVSAATIQKELVTLGTVWRWAFTAQLVSGPFPRRGLRLPKTEEKPPFQTWDEIERQIEQNGLKDRDADLLWDCLYMRRSEIDEALAHVEKHAAYPFIYPMFVMAGHTGARRSELLRSLKADFDFAAGIVTIHERKRVRGKRTTRRVNLSPTLRKVMLHWFEHQHPGGPFTFCHSVTIRRSRSHTQRGNQISPDQIHDHFQRSLAGSKWRRIRGWHCFRHSFISNLACEGIDQRIIDEFAGHTTEQMRRRYRHLFPDVKQAAIEKVFG